MSEQTISRAEKLSSAALAINEADQVMQAARWADVIVRYQRRWGGGTKQSAVLAAAEKHSLPASMLQRLLYPCRWPQEIAAGVYLRLGEVAAAVERLDARLATAVERELQLADAEGLDAANSFAVRMATAALGKTSSAPTAGRRSGYVDNEGAGGERAQAA